MDINQLRAFAAVYRHKSFTRASEYLGISQPTISEHIRNLERELGSQLFERLPRVVLPTREAEAIYPKAVHIIEELDGIAALAGATSQTITGHILIGSSTIPGSYILPHRIAAFRALHPEVSFEVRIADSRITAQRCLEHELAMGIVGDTTDRDSLIVTPFFDDELVLCAPKSLSAKAVITPKELAAMPFVMREEGSGTRSTIERHLSKLHIKLKPAAILGSTDAVKRAVMEGLGVSFLSRIAVRDEIAQGRIFEIGVQGLEIKRKFNIISHKKRVLPRPCEAFRDFLLGQITPPA